MKYLLLTIIAPVMKKTVQKFTCYGALLVNYWYSHCGMPSALPILGNVYVTGI